MPVEQTVDELPERESIPPDGVKDPALVEILLDLHRMQVATRRADVPRR